MLMQDLMNEINQKAKFLNADTSSISELYDKYAPALYGRIIKVVKQKEIAEKILEKVFLNSLNDQNVEERTHITQFISLLNSSRNKAYSTLKALKTLNACCSDNKDVSLLQTNLVAHPSKIF